MNLPGRNNDGRDPRTITLNQYRDTVLAAMDASGEQWFIIVGHSFGGMTISNVGEARADHIQALVYLSALLPYQSGISGAVLSELDTTSVVHVPGNVVISPPAWLSMKNASVAADAFANDAKDAAQTAEIVGSLIREPAVPFAMPVTVSAKYFGLQKVYIRTAQDHVVTPILQDAMIRNMTSSIRQVFSIDSGHASYVTQPEQVARAIMDAITLTNDVQHTKCASKRKRRSRKLSPILTVSKK